MARVDHRLIKQRLNEQRSKITDRQFFTSRLLAGHFEDMAVTQTRRYHYKRRVRVNLYWKPKIESVAYTDNMYININAGNPMITQVKGRQERYQVVCGLFAHELGHVLYTDFLAAQTYENYLAGYRWYPCMPDLKTTADNRRERSFWEYVKEDSRNLKMVQKIAHSISNVIEDGYIENRMMNDFPGKLGMSLKIMRERFFEMIPTVTQLIEQEEDGAHHIYESILQILLSYTEFGEIKYAETPLSDERIQTVFGLIPDIDQALMSQSAKDRWDCVNLILIRCWDYIEEFVEYCKKRQEEIEAAGDLSGLEDVISTILASIAGGSEAGKGSSTPVSGSGESLMSSVTAEKRVKTREDAEKVAEEPEDADESEELGDTEEPEDSEIRKELEDPDEELEESEDSKSLEESEESDEELKASEELEGTEELEESGMYLPEIEDERSPFSDYGAASEPIGGTTEWNEAYEREWDERASDDIDRLLEKMAEKAVCKQLENERLKELNDMAQNISYGDIHSGVNIRINRMASVDEEMIDQYEAATGPLLTISRQLQKSLVKELEDSRRGGKRTGLMMGRRLDVHALCRNDGRVFYKNKLPDEKEQIAVCVLLDESGSMRLSDRSSYARAAAIILYDFCKGLHIPVMIYGHSTRSNTVELYSYAEFESYDQDDKYRLMDIRARNENRDGAALRYVAERLSGRSEEIKLLILVSDGQPIDHGYYGSAAEEDLRGIKQEYQRKGILFVAAAIGDDKQSIERIYGDSFMDITDLNQLPVKLANVVKRHIRI